MTICSGTGSAYNGRSIRRERAGAWPTVTVPCTGAALILVTFGFAAAQQSYPVQGRVLGPEEESIAGADIRVVDTRWVTLTDARGLFTLTLPPGNWQVRASAIGFRDQTMHVAVGEDGSIHARLLFRLVRDPIQLKGITAETARAPPLAATVTTETVRQVPPLGEPDVFRAMVLLPAISQPNDLKGRIHLAGGSSDETGIRLDGHPLQDPFHLLGLFGAFNVAALEKADVLIHHVPGPMGGKLSGLIDLQTRAPAAAGEVELVTGLLTTGATASFADLPGEWDLLASGRFTYLDKLARVADLDIPLLGFRDGLVRLGKSWDSEWRAEALAFSTRDFFQAAELRGAEGYEPLEWGESLVGVRLERSRGAWTASARASHNRATVELDERRAGRPNHVASRRDRSSVAVDVASVHQHWDVGFGAAFDHREHRQAWTAQGLVHEIFSPRTPAEFSGSERQGVLRLHGETGVVLGERLGLGAGLRLWRAATQAAGRATRQSPWYPAPWLRGGLAASEHVQVEASLQRRFQFDAQLEEPIEGSIAAPLFLLVEPRRADVAAMAISWASERTRHGGLATARVQAFWQVVEEYEPGTWSPTAWDAPHTLVLFMSSPLPWGLTLSAAYHAHSGRATTPVVGRTFEPYDDVRQRWLKSRYLLGDRNSIRVPPYHRLDLGVRHGWRWGEANWTASFQVLNLFARENAIDYDWRVYFTDISGFGAPRRAGRSGLPILPSLALEVRW